MNRKILKPQKLDFETGAADWRLPKRLYIQDAEFPMDMEQAFIGDSLSEEMGGPSLGDSFDHVDRDGYWIKVDVTETEPTTSTILEIKGFGRGTPQWSKAGANTWTSVDLLPKDGTIYIYLW